MKFLLFNAEGCRASGVATFCRRLAQEAEGFFTVSLEVEDPSLMSANEFAVGSEESHDASRVAELALSFLERTIGAGGDWALVPNVGTTCYEACLLLRRRLLRRGARRVGILAVCHSDDENQFRVIAHYQTHLHAAMHVSAYIRDRLVRDLPWLSVGGLYELKIPLPRQLPEPQPRSPGRRLSLAYCGRLERSQKRIDRLGSVLEGLLEAGLEFSFTAMGDGRDRASLEICLKGLGSRYAWDFYECTGVLGQADLIARLARVDVVLLTSEYEGTPLVIVEALAMGACPVIMDFASLRGSRIREFTVLVKQGDTGAMAEAVLRLARDRDRLESLAASGARFARSEFTVPAAIDQLRNAGTVAVERSAVSELSDSAWAEFGETRLRRLTCRIVSLDLQKRRVAVFGIGVFGRKLIDALARKSIRPIALADSDAQKWGKAYRGIEIGSVESLVSHAVEDVVIGSDCFVSEMETSLLEAFERGGRLAPRVVSMRDIDMPNSSL